MTNYEKIKNMTVEEMEQFIEHTMPCGCCIYVDDEHCECLKCKEGITAWLKQEVVDNDKL